MKRSFKRTLPAILAILVLLIVQVGVSHVQAVSTWVLCANENGTCNFTGTRLVRYGANGSYNYGTFTDSVACTNDVFGDPLYGTAKYCWYEALPAVTLNPSPFDFGGVEVGTTSGAQSFTLTNSGDSDLIVGSLGISGDFALANDLCSAQTITPGNSCTFDVTFTPPSLGAKNGSVSIPSDAASSPDGLTLSGTGADNTNPVGSIDNGPFGPTNATAATFDFSATDNLTVAPNFTFWCALDGGGWVDCSSDPGTWSYLGLGEGWHTFSFFAQDESGNDSATETYNWYVDLTAPTASIDSGPSHPTKSTSATFEFSATDNNPPAPTLAVAQNLIFWCDLDGLGWENCTSNPGTWSYTGLGEGWHTFSFIARDAAGNDSPTETYNWYVDLTPPNASIDSAPANPSNFPVATFTFSATDDWTNAALSNNGINPASVFFFCKLDGGLWVGCDSRTITYTGLAEGPHTFYLDTYDQVGNLTSLSYTWYVDFTPTNAPKVQWIPPDGLPEGVIATELHLTNVTEFGFKVDGKAYKYAPPNPWQLFAGSAFKLDSANGFEEPIKICFYYPKALYPDGKWYGKIYFLDGSNWVGLTTTQETLAGYGSSPFLCANATQPGIYIVADHWAMK